MNAASLPEWATAFAIGTALYVPGALLILALDHDLTSPARTLANATERAVDRLLLVLVTPVALKEATR
ncbi:hypothetical protein ACIQTN_26020 [Streptomyces werraensis]|uniref:hypothetical protein n=1 Tax=Streptomyces werraensis TaxID=68284 RepID=UPI0037FB5C5A